MNDIGFFLVRIIVHFFLLADDELTMYSDGELYTKNHSVDHSMKTTTTKPLKRSTGLTRSTSIDKQNMSQPCFSRSDKKELQPFMPTYAKFASPAMSFDNGMVCSVCSFEYSYWTQLAQQMKKE